MIFSSVYNLLVWKKEDNSLKRDILVVDTNVKLEFFDLETHQLLKIIPMSSTVISETHIPWFYRMYLAGSSRQLWGSSCAHRDCDSSDCYVFCLSLHLGEHSSSRDLDISRVPQGDDCKPLIAAGVTIAYHRWSRTLRVSHLSPGPMIQEDPLCKISLSVKFNLVSMFLGGIYLYCGYTVDGAKEESPKHLSCHLLSTGELKKSWILDHLPTRIWQGLFFVVKFNGQLEIWK